MLPANFSTKDVRIDYTLPISISGAFIEPLNYNLQFVLFYLTTPSSPFTLYLPKMDELQVTLTCDKDNREMIDLHMLIHLTYMTVPALPSSL